MIPIGSLAAILPILLFKISVGPASADALVKEVSRQYYRIADADDPRKGFLVESVDLTGDPTQSGAHKLMLEFCDGEKASIDLASLRPEFTDCDDEPSGTFSVSLDRLKGAVVYTARYGKIGTISEIGTVQDLRSEGRGGLIVAGQVDGRPLTNLPIYATVTDSSGDVLLVDLPLLDPGLKVMQLGEKTLSLIASDEFLSKINIEY